MVTEAHLERLASGLAPVTPGWFIVNTADAAWVENECYGGVCIFESDNVVLQGRPDLTAYEKPGAGFTIRVVPPGQPSGGYHAELVQEDFLILVGERGADHRGPGAAPWYGTSCIACSIHGARVRRQGNGALRDPRHGKTGVTIPNWRSVPSEVALLAMAR